MKIMKIIGYLVIVFFIFAAIDIIVNKRLVDDGLGYMDIPPVLGLMIGGFILYGAYILWDNELR